VNESVTVQPLLTMSGAVGGAAFTRSNGAANSSIAAMTVKNARRRIGDVMFMLPLL
jgi:hypothetical protein